jgi:hydrogenase-4 membrane subunit HyfE
VNFEPFTLPAVLLVALTALILLISPDWRVSILALAGQYVGVFVLVALVWPLEMAVTKLVTGWMAGAILGVAVANLLQEWPFLEPEEAPEEQENLPEEAPETSPKIAPRGGFASVTFPSSRLFRLLAALLVCLAVLSIAPEVTQWVPGVTIEQAWGGLILIGIGLLQLGFTGHTFRTVLGLLTMLAGFEILYAVVESSTLVAGLLAGVNLILALAGAYLLTSPSMEETA